MAEVLSTCRAPSPSPGYAAGRHGRLPGHRRGGLHRLEPVRSAPDRRPQGRGRRRPDHGAHRQPGRGPEPRRGVHVRARGHPVRRAAGGVRPPPARGGHAPGRPDLGAPGRRGPHQRRQREPHRPPARPALRGGGGHPKGRVRVLGGNHLRRAPQAAGARDRPARSRPDSPYGISKKAAELYLECTGASTASTTRPWPWPTCTGLARTPTARAAWWRSSGRRCWRGASPRCSATASRPGTTCTSTTWSTRSRWPQTALPTTC